MTGMMGSFVLTILDEDIAREKEKLYQAIGYAKDGKLPIYPNEVGRK